MRMQKLFKQLQRNARLVPSDLGGGQYGHLFMILSKEDWNNLPDTAAIIEPADPGAFDLPGQLIASEIAVGQKTHDEEKKD